MRNIGLWVALLCWAGCKTTERPPKSESAKQADFTERQREQTVPTAWPHQLDRKPAVYANGLVASDAALATEVGVSVLREGGNAIDATVATALVLAVVFPEAGNIGGGGFAVGMFKNEPFALDFREVAPALSTRDMFIDESGKVTDKSQVGPLAAGVPGSVQGLWDLHNKYGTKPWPELLAPAIRLAREGFVLSAEFVAMASSENLEIFAPTKKLFRPNGQALTVSQRWQNPDLASTLERIAKEGPADFYRGETADLIVASMKSHGGIISHKDLHSYRTIWRSPITINYRQHQLVTMPPPSSGGLVIAFLANFLERDDLRSMGHNSTALVHVFAEGLRRAFARRNHFLGDPAFVTIPRERFLDKEAADRERARMSLKRPTPSTEVSFPSGTDREGKHTTHFSVVDKDGNAVALTTTINVDYGSKLVVAGAGFILNNEMDDFATNPGHANAFGLVQGEANAVAPGKRPLSSMTPTIVLDAQSRPVIVTGASGGPTIISATFQVISNVLDHKFDVNRAVALPRIHHQHLPDAIYREANGLTATVEAELADKGHKLLHRSYVGNAATIIRSSGGWTGNADPRQLGSLADGY